MDIKKGDIIENIKVVDIGYKGDAIGKKDGFTFFINRGIPGDILKVKILKKKQNYAKAKLIEIHSESSSKVKPKCNYFYDCGGCQIQNIKYIEQLKLKKEKIKNDLIRIGKLNNIKINEVIKMKKPYNYRNKAQFKIEKENKKTKIGFYKKRTNNVVDIKECVIQNDLINKILLQLSKLIKKNKISVYDNKTGKGIIKELIIRVSEQTKNIMVILVTNGETLPYKNLIIKTLSSNDNIKSIIQNINYKNKEGLGDKNIKIYGDEYIIDILNDMKFKISPHSFYQINDKQTQKLYNKVLEFANLKGEEVIFDLYSGTGTIGLFLANKAKKIYGVEVVEEAISDANENAKLNNINNAIFINGKAENVIPKLYNRGVKADLVIVDPPRQGCDEKLLKTIVDMEVKKVIYVSCKPSTLARDLKYLSENGYSIKEVQPIDMFPHSIHIENCVKLEKIKEK
ncbi:MAG: 23S rRNA (uracil(1939)-C(5))-methyltransferase RlmD [Fusobacteriota bacterium]